MRHEYFPIYGHKADACLSGNKADHKSTLELPGYAATNRIIIVVQELVEQLLGRHFVANRYR
jgi:hypothetical protein